MGRRKSRASIRRELIKDMRKINDLLRLMVGQLVYAPSRDKPLAELPENDQAYWRELARQYDLIRRWAEHQELYAYQQELEVKRLQESGIPIEEW